MATPKVTLHQSKYKIESISILLETAAFSKTSLHCPGHAEEQWLVLNVLGGGNAKRLAIESRYNGRGYIPWTGVAAQIARQEPGRDTETAPAVEGQAFTFLPLPVKTGLPIHVSPSRHLTICCRAEAYGKDGKSGGWTIGKSLKCHTFENA